MEQAGWVRRTADPEDRRINLVEMTDSGRRLYRRAHAVYYGRVEEIMAALGDSNRNELTVALEIIRHRAAQS